MRIIVGSDHVGLPLKKAVVNFLNSSGEQVYDVGPFETGPAVDYPDYAFQVARAVASHQYERGILFCGTGLGMSMAANKVPGVRAALCSDEFSVRLSRAHNNANVLCMGNNVITPPRAEAIVRVWLDTPYDHGRHEPRLAKMDAHFFNPPPLPAALESFYDILPNHFSIAISPNETSFGPLVYTGQFEQGLRHAAEAGFRYVELSLRKPEIPPSEFIEDMLARYSLSVSAIATGQSCIHDHLCLASPRSERREEVVARLKDHIRLAARLQTSVIIGGVRGKLTGSPEDQSCQRQAAITAIRECVAFAFERQVTILLEPINRYETNFVNTAQDGLDLIESVGYPNFKLLLDSFHMNIEEADISATLHRVGERLGYIHFADSNRLAPGNGHINFPGILQTLAQMGYTGFISAEILPLPDDHTALQQAAAYFQIMPVRKPTYEPA